MGKTRQRRNTTPRALATALVLWVLPLAALLAIIWTYWNFSREFSLIKEAYKPETIAINGSRLDSAGDGSLLHPEDHIFREPKTLDYNWEITLGSRSPDGVKKDVYLVNGQFPGPTIEARSGDKLVIRIQNGLSTEGVSIHCHGLRLMNQNAYDGAAGVTQSPIPPSASFTYTINIGDDEHGTFWWHGHARLHRGDGLYGGLVVHKPQGGEEKNLDYGVDEERLLLVGDWFHRNSTEVIEWYQSPSAFAKEPIPDSMVINGLGNFDCDRAPPARPVDCTAKGDRQVWSIFGQQRLHMRIRLRVVNVGIMSAFSLAIPGMDMRPVEVDGGTRVQATLEAAHAIGVLYPGERVDVVLSPGSGHIGGSESILISLDNKNFVGVNPSLQRNQSFPLYDGGILTGSSSLNSDDFFQAIDLSDLRGADAPPWTEVGWSDAITKIVVYAKTQALAHMDNKPMGFINNTSWAPPDQPLVSLPRTEWTEIFFVPFISLDSQSSIHEMPQQWVELTINNLDDGPHPFHLHGHSFYVISRYTASKQGGWGSFNPFSDDPMPNAGDEVAPLLKDTVAVPRRGHVVLRFLAANPGIWMLHCHMLVHQGTGMGMALQIGNNV